MKVIQDLQGTRPLIVHIFDEIVRTLPDGVFFRGMERKGQTIRAIRGGCCRRNPTTACPA